MPEDGIQLKVHEEKKKKDKTLHDELEETHRKVEKIREHAKEILNRSLPEQPVEKKNEPEPVEKFKRKYSEEKEYVERITTGIEGLDELLEGGLPERSVTVLTGTCGTGKSTFAMNFLIEGALHNEPGVYVSLEESMEETLEQMKLFGLPIDELIKSNMLIIVQPELYNFDALLTTIEDAVERVKAKRLVIDSASLIGMYFENEFKVRKSLLDLGHMLKRLGCTTLAISEIKEDSAGLSPYGVEEFVVDGVIVLYYIKKGNMFLRAIAIRKMRVTKHSTKIHPLEIRRPGGIIVYPSEEVFAEV